jgi:hypothetical protein
MFAQIISGSIKQTPAVDHLPSHFIIGRHSKPPDSEERMDTQAMHRCCSMLKAMRTSRPNKAEEPRAFNQHQAPARSLSK